MTRTASLQAINCTACGAGLDLLGGGRVTTHICPYCATELDARDDYRALRKFSDMPRPDTPFSLGQTGKIMGVDWTIIGTLGHREDWGGKSWTWVEHQLYSPTHGYAWLTVEDGHLTYARRVRGAPQALWISERWVETAENVPHVSHRGETFKYLQTTKSRLTFAEGEFTWAPNVGEATTTISAMSPGAMLDFSETGSEREIYRSTYLPHGATMKAFGLAPKDLVPRGVHALQPYKAGENTDFLAFASTVAAAACLVIAITFSALPGFQILAPTTLSTASLPQEVSFDITDDSKLAGIRLNSNVSNAWSYYEMELTDPEDAPVFEAGRTVEYYYGREDGENWSEGSRTTALYFRPPGTGTYTLSIDQPETGTWGTTNIRPATDVTVSARQGMSSGFWMYVLFAGFAAIAVLTYGRRHYHRMRRWKHSDWDDD
ncbi:DUF4178 domain-containing protein [Tropicibacter oceani]|uniref:DUF4178 domain-containing protein n=1 Tax=Tropicibacter oceani TaxID=3058420 RepID=A0ABY8QJ57_9RHOB|nr:DUF4178 domain-containing protein [Tropicibacter oceani]WGW04654.1 DUF4178 domain-containing protein [Tropicibacter oceani]